MSFDYIPAYEGNYTKNRAAQGGKITEITVHHTAGVIDVYDLGSLWKRAGRNGSSHYGVCGAAVAQYVLEEDVAWTNSNWAANCRAVTIETCNSGGAPNWPVADDTLQTLIELVANIARRNNLGTLIVGKNLTQHNQYAATACPGPHLKSKMQYIADEANKINSATSSTPSPTTPTTESALYRVYRSIEAYEDSVTAIAAFEKYKQGHMAEFILCTVGDGKWRIAQVTMATSNLQNALNNLTDDCIICGSDMTKHRVYGVVTANKTKETAVKAYAEIADNAPNDVVLTSIGGDDGWRMGVSEMATENLSKAINAMAADKILC